MRRRRTSLSGMVRARNRTDGEPQPYEGPRSSRSRPGPLRLGGVALASFSRGAARPRTIVFYGFSILAEVFNDAIFPAFEARWREETGEQIEFISSFAGSGTITNQVIMGVPADLVLCCRSSPTRDRLADAGVVAAKSWRALPHRGVVNRTPFIILVRPGNPKRIRDFEDLARPGIGVVHPDPLTSGGANWAILAEYGAGAPGAAGSAGRRLQLLRGIWKNVVAQAASARAARTQFENGFGDALITYEQEALADGRAASSKADVVYPRRTISVASTPWSSWTGTSDPAETRARRRVRAFPLERRGATGLRRLRLPQRRSSDATEATRLRPRSRTRSRRRPRRLGSAPSATIIEDVWKSPRPSGAGR